MDLPQFFVFLHHGKINDKKEIGKTGSQFLVNRIESRRKTAFQAEQTIRRESANFFDGAAVFRAFALLLSLEIFGRVRFARLLRPLFGQIDP